MIALMRPLRPVKLWRDQYGRARADIPHIVVHSPTGIEWGYYGSGPADLAISLACYFAEKPTGEQIRRLKKLVAGIPVTCREYVITPEQIAAALRGDED
jgi:hypothetical protein